MDAASISALTVAVTAMLVTIGGQIVAIITSLNNGKKLDVNNQQISTVTEKIGTVVDTAAVIEKNTNSRLASQDVTIRDLAAEVKALTAVIAQLHTDKAVADAALILLPPDTGKK